MLENKYIFKYFDISSTKEGVEVHRMLLRNNYDSNRVKIRVKNKLEFSLKEIEREPILENLFMKENSISFDDSINNYLNIELIEKCIESLKEEDTIVVAKLDLEKLSLREKLILAYETLLARVERIARRNNEDSEEYNDIRIRLEQLYAIEK